MHRSPFIASTLLLLSAILWAQQPGSSEPKDASGTPQTPLANPQPPAPAATPNSQVQAPGTAQPHQPQTTQPSSSTPVPSAVPPQQEESSRRTKQSASNAKEPVAPPPQPKTEILDSSATSSGLATDGHDPILDPPPFPSGSTTLVGGTIRDVDRIRNRMVIKVFGGSHWTVNFDERTHIFRNGAETTQLALKKGERVYVDTMLDNNKHDILARNIRVGVAAAPADASGQITDIDSARAEVSLRDNINSVPVHFGVDHDTRIINGNTPIALKDLKPGALVQVKFSAQSGYRGIAREITVVAMPGAAFTFSGKVTYLDVHRGLLAVQNVDGKTYDIHFSPKQTREAAELAVGTPVKIVAVFEGSQYTVQSLTVNSGSGAEAKE